MTTHSRRFTTCCLLTALLLAIPSVAIAQDIYFRLEEGQKFNRDDFIRLLQKEASVASDKEQEETALAVRFLLYPLTDRKMHTEPGRMATLVRECNSFVQRVFVSPDTRNVPVKDAFRKSMVVELDRILSPKPQLTITRVNASLVLSSLASATNGPEVVDLLVKVIGDPNQIDAARYYACKGLRELLAREPRGAAIKDPASRLKVAQTLVRFIERKVAIADSSPEEDKEGFRVVRRQALRALTELNEPGNPVEAHVALTLIRVMRRDANLLPDPRIDEQVEAAVALSRLPTDPKQEFQVGYAANQLGRFLFEFGTRFKNRTISRDPWKIHGARLEEALLALRKTYPADPAVQAIVPLGLQIVVDVGNNRAPSTDQLFQWLEANPLPQTAVYKGDASKWPVTPRVDN